MFSYFCSKCKTLIKITLTTCFFVALSPAFADMQWCTGTLSGSFVRSDGRFYISGSWLGDWTQVCNLNADWKGIPASTCQYWHHMIQAAVASHSPVVAFYLNAPSCSQLPTYDNAPGLGYFRLLNE